MGIEKPSHQRVVAELGFLETLGAAANSTLSPTLDSSDYPQAIGAFWGEINVAIHKNLQLAGVLTNGVLRDLGSLDSGFQVIASSLGPSHAHVHIVEINCKVEVFSLKIRPMDIIHADRHGAVIIPANYLAIMPACVRHILQKETPLTAARKQGFNLEILEQKWEQFANFPNDILK